MRPISQAVAVAVEACAEDIRQYGEEEMTFQAARNFAESLVATGRHQEAKDLLREWMRKAGERRDFAPNDVITSDESTAAINVKYRQVYAMALYQDTSASREDLVEAVATLRELARYWKRVAGDVNPDTLEVLTELDRAGMTLEDVAAP